MRKIYLALLLSLFALVTTRTNAQGIFMATDPITRNGSQIENHRDEVELTSIQYGISSEASFIKGTGASVGKAVFSALTLTKFYDVSSVALVDKMVTGVAIPKIEINFYDRDNRVSYRIQLEDVFVTSYETSSTGTCDHGCPDLQESISLVFRKYTIFEANAQGGKLQQKFSFDVSQNRKL
ncbi:type VI secretion system tube protein Hcp [Siphonobacter sp.]|uniref:type VI secretion system tube protein Hcp n=1 Tax=Siphonobacter sp. TaxID=1869184 RepID=UPI003B3ACEBE